jgi:hypothetical protein
MKPLAIIAAAGLCLPAVAATTLRLEVSRALQEDWHSSIQALSGDSVDIRVVLDHTGPPVLGFGSLIFQPTVSNWTASDVMAPLVNGGVGGQVTVPIGAVQDLPGQYGRIIPYAQYGFPASDHLMGHVNTHAGVTYLRIAQATITSWIGDPGNTSGGSGINMRQFNDIGRSTGDPAFSPATSNIVIFKFGITLAPGNPSVRTMVADAPINGIWDSPGNPYVGWWQSMMEIIPSGLDRPTIIPAQIFVNVPAPGPLSLLAAALFAVRRRRATP